MAASKLHNIRAPCCTTEWPTDLSPYCGTAWVKGCNYLVNFQEEKDSGNDYDLFLVERVTLYLQFLKLLTLTHMGKGFENCYVSGSYLDI